MLSDLKVAELDFVGLVCKITVEAVAIFGRTQKRFLVGAGLFGQTLDIFGAKFIGTQAGIAQSLGTLPEFLRLAGVTAASGFGGEE